MKITAAEYREMQKPKKKPTAKWESLPDKAAAPGIGTILIGIDPGSVVTGFALQVENEPPVLKGFKSHCEAIIYALEVVQYYGRQNIHFIVEDARKVPKNAWFAKKNGTAKNTGAGYVKALSKDWQMFCEVVAKVPFTLVAPNPARTKWEPERFEKETGIKTLKGEHHLRDAFLLINYRNAA